jgi:hypothetical protein
VKKPEEKRTRRAYPVLPYLIGLFVTVVALVLLSYLVQLRNRQELMQANEPQMGVALSIECAEKYENLY